MNSSLNNKVKLSCESPLDDELLDELDELDELELLLELLELDELELLDDEALPTGSAFPPQPSIKEVHSVAVTSEAVLIISFFI